MNNRLVRNRPDHVYGPDVLDGEQHARCVECKALLADDQEAWFLGTSHLAVFFCEKCGGERATDA